MDNLHGKVLFGPFSVNKGLYSIWPLPSNAQYSIYRTYSVYFEFICAFNLSSVNKVYYSCNEVNRDR